jgi:hypothetical protein
VWQYTMANGVDSNASYPLVWYDSVSLAFLGLVAVGNVVSELRPSAGLRSDTIRCHMIGLQYYSYGHVSFLLFCRRKVRRLMGISSSALLE